MKKQTYYCCLAVILLLMVLALGVGMTTGNLVLVAIIIIGAVGAIWFCHKRVTDVMTDDLESAISGRAALAALEVAIIIAAIGFAAAMGFYFNGGWGNGMHIYENGSVLVSASQIWPHGNIISNESYLIADPAHLTLDDIVALDTMSVDTHHVREFPYVFGMAMGAMVVLLVALYAGFSVYYHRKYGE